VVLAADALGSDESTETPTNASCDSDLLRHRSLSKVYMYKQSKRRTADRLASKAFCLIHPKLKLAKLLTPKMAIVAWFEECQIWENEVGDVRIQ
jgi:hypothetical protein